MKSEVVFVLENAGWPALLVDAATTILCANQAAIKALGLDFAGGRPLLSAIWPPENGSTAEQFLAQWERLATATVVLKFHVKGGGTSVYSTAICTCMDDGHKVFIL